MLVRELMTQGPALCTPDTEIREAARLMAEYDCGALPVVESPQNPRAKGIVTDRDITVRVVAQGRNPQEARVADAMTASTVTVTPETNVAQAASLMESHKVRRLLVVEKDTCVGILSLADVVRGTSTQEGRRVVKAVSEPTEEPSRV